MFQHTNKMSVKIFFLIMLSVVLFMDYTNADPELLSTVEPGE